MPAAADREQALHALATPAYGRRILAASTASTRSTARAVPAGAQLIAQVAELDWLPTQGNTRHVVVTLDQRLTPLSGPPQPPVSTVFLVTLQHVATGWQVADFEPQPT